MWDAVDVAAIPEDANVIGVYVDRPPFINTVAAANLRFPTAQKVSFTAFGVPGARIGDRESGDMDAPQLAQWDSDEIAADRRPTNYCSIDNVPECVDAINALKLPLALIDWFPADWNGRPHLAVIPGLHVVGTQYANPRYTGGDYDLSLVLSDWLNPPLPPSKEDDMIDSYTFKGQFVTAQINDSGGLYVKSQALNAPFTNDNLAVEGVVFSGNPKFTEWFGFLWVQAQGSGPFGLVYRWQSADGVHWSDVTVQP